MKNFLLIPVLNEEKSIGLVLNEVNKNLIKDIVVIDNGSTDKTREVLSEHNVSVVIENQRGYGKACLSGIDFLRTELRPKPHDNILFIDGDYSDYPPELDKIIESLNDYNFVIGSRMKGNMQKGAMPIHAKFGNWLSSTILGVMYPHYKFSDLGPMRGIKWSVLEEIEMRDENFGWTIEMQMKVLQKKYSCIEIPVSYKHRVGTSKISGSLVGSVKAGVKILYSIIKYS